MNEDDLARVYQAWARNWFGFRFIKWRIGFWRDCTCLYTRSTIFQALQVMIGIVQHLGYADARIKLVEYDRAKDEAKLLRELTLQEAQHALTLTDSQLELYFYPWGAREPDMADFTSGVF